MGHLDEGRTQRRQQSRRPLLKTDGFALSPQNGAAGTASLGFRTWRVMDL
jgi:hypothetical protein